MERLSIFDIYKIGVGPSSSHTLGPWKAAIQFSKRLQSHQILSLRIHLFGSLSKTGKGHATDTAVVLGLLGHQPETIPTDQIETFIANQKVANTLSISTSQFEFIADRDIIFEKAFLATHPNALTFKAITQESGEIAQTFYSVGGGFITTEEEKEEDPRHLELPFPIDSGKDLIDHAEKHNNSIAETVYNNELKFNSKDVIHNKVLQIYDTMVDAVYRGCHKDGILPGGLNVTRRAQKLSKNLLGGKYIEDKYEWLQAIKATGRDFDNINQWVSCFAIAVNEENASLGRIVTSPTNGAAGVIPAVLLYFRCFCDFQGKVDIMKFMLTSGEIGCIFKKRATISAAVGGCQAEIGVSSAMAAAGLTALKGGSPRHVLMAAEIAMEHHLGLTCDPIGGLVQIPCIERNAMGAMKAITASTLAMSGDPSHAIVDFDTVVKTMWDTAQDMHHNYKETSDGGLAFNLPVVLPNC